eukprot:Platyproteum_vivax@DN6594_c0_g1_i1.p1
MSYTSYQREAGSSTPTFSSTQNVPKLNTDSVNPDSGAAFSFRSQNSLQPTSTTVIKDESQRTVQKFVKYMPIDETDTKPLMVEVSPRLVIDKSIPYGKEATAFDNYESRKVVDSGLGEYAKYLKSPTKDDFQPVYSANDSNYKSYTTPTTTTYTSPTTDYKSYINPTSDYKSYTNPTSDYKSYTNPTSDYKSYTNPTSTNYTTDYKSYTAGGTSTSPRGYTSYTTSAMGTGTNPSNDYNFTSNAEIKTYTTATGGTVFEKTEYIPTNISNDYSKYFTSDYKTTDPKKSTDYSYTAYKSSANPKSSDFRSYEPQSYGSKELKKPYQDLFASVEVEAQDREPTSTFFTRTATPTKVDIIRLDSVQHALDSPRSDTSEQLRRAEQESQRSHRNFWGDPEPEKSVPVLDMSFKDTQPEDDGLTSAERLARDRDRLLATMNSFRKPLNSIPREDVPSAFSPHQSTFSRLDSNVLTTNYPSAVNYAAQNSFGAESFGNNNFTSNYNDSTYKPTSYEPTKYDYSSQRIVSQDSFNPNSYRGDHDATMDAFSMPATSKQQYAQEVYAEAEQSRTTPLTRAALEQLEASQPKNLDKNLDVPQEYVEKERRGSRASSNAGGLKLSAVTRSATKYDEFKEGWMMKKHPTEERWSKRWVRATKSCLTYSDGPQMKPKAMLDFQRCEWSVETMTTSYSTTWKITPTGYKRVFCFKLTEDTPPDEIKAWAAHIKKQIDEGTKFRQKVSSLPHKFWKADAEKKFQGEAKPEVPTNSHGMHKPNSHNVKASAPKKIHKNPSTTVSGSTLGQGGQRPMGETESKHSPAHPVQRKPSPSPFKPSCLMRKK